MNRDVQASIGRRRDDGNIVVLVLFTGLMCCGPLACSSKEDGTAGAGGATQVTEPTGPDLGSAGAGVQGGTGGSGNAVCIAERCDGTDNDCDGEIDNVVGDLCASCSSSCVLAAGDGSPLRPWMPTESNAVDVTVTSDGAITLDRTPIRAHAVWVANSVEGTVSKLDSETNTELARYVSVLPGVSNYTWDQGCSDSGDAFGNCPSRTAVDQNYDAYVANRAFNGQGTITKYASALRDCVDRNMNGVIDTSRDVDGDGSIDIADPAEFLGDEDECILWTRTVGDMGDLPRALAIGMTPPDVQVGNVWVGLFHGRSACELDQRTGDTLQCVPLPGVNPYGAVGDAAGKIWFAHRGGNLNVLVSVDAFSYAVEAAEPWPAQSTDPACTGQAYGITADREGRLYVADSNCQARVWTYDPNAMSWAHFELEGGGTARGVAADDEHLWVAVSHNTVGFNGGTSGRVLQYRRSDLGYVTTHQMPIGRGPVGVGVSFDGSIWAVNQANDMASRLDPGSGTWTERQVGRGPYTYSDFIGFGLNALAKPRGHYRFVMEGCAGDGNAWHGADYRADVPVNTSVSLWARTASTPEGLADEGWIGPFTGAPTSFDAAPGPIGTSRYLEVEVRLSTDDEAVAPKVYRVDVVHDCPIDVK